MSRLLDVYHLRTVVIAKRITLDGQSLARHLNIADSFTRELKQMNVLLVQSLGLLGLIARSKVACDSDGSRRDKVSIGRGSEAFVEASSIGFVARAVARAIVERGSNISRLDVDVWNSCSITVALVSACGVC